ncbi:MAG: glycosyltransferase family 1 protein, partial [Acidobacteria bacterium]|nr:glycosyltransferase family 1 protein [Acidobacteriota bacterium]
MKISLLAYGTRGDVQPFLGLAHALQSRGHTVRLAAPRNFEGWIRSAGISFVPFPIDTQELFSREAAQRMLAKGDIQSFFKWLAEIEKPLEGGLQNAVIGVSEDADLLVTHVLMEDRAAAVGAARKVPVIPVYFYPIPPSGDLPSPFITTRNLGFGMLNRLTHKLLIDLLWKSARNDVAAMRKRLGAPPVNEPFTRQAKRRGLPVVLAYADALSPRPSDWNGNCHITGPIELSEELRLSHEGERPERLARWIESKPQDPPVFLGFGSMPILDPGPVLRAARKALEATGTRGIVGAGWTSFGDVDDERLQIVPSVDHGWLFPRCRAAVHHGGAGTTHASLGAGLPTLVCSVF